MDATTVSLTVNSGREDGAIFGALLTTHAKQIKRSRVNKVKGPREGGLGEKKQIF